MKLGNKSYFSLVLFFFIMDFSFAEDKIINSPLINLNEIKPSFEELNEENINSATNKNIKEKKN